MSTDARSIVERYVAVHVTGDTSALAEIVAPDFRYRSGASVGVEKVVENVKLLRDAFSDLTVDVKHIVCEGEWAAFHFIIEGTHTGAFAGRAPTGKRIRWPGADFVRVRDGKLVELWNIAESMSMLETIGAYTRGT